MVGVLLVVFFSIVINISSLTTTEMPFDEFIVFPIEGMCISGDVDIYNTWPDYVYFMHSNCAHLRFFEWFYEKLT